MANIINVKMDGCRAYVEYATTTRTYSLDRIPGTVVEWAISHLRPVDGVRVWEIIRGIDGRPCSELVYGSREQADGYAESEGYDVWSIDEATDNDIEELIKVAGLMPFCLDGYAPHHSDDGAEAAEPQECQGDESRKPSAAAAIVPVEAAPIAVIEDKTAADGAQQAGGSTLTAVKALALRAARTAVYGAMLAGTVAAEAAPAVLSAVSDGARAAAPIIAEALRTAASAFISIGFKLGLVLMDIWYWMTTYLPIAARKVRFWFLWDFAPAAVKVAKEAVKVAKEAVKVAKEAVKVAKATAGASAAIAAALAGWMLVGILATAGTALRASRAIRGWAVSGWAMREEILQEMAA